MIIDEDGETVKFGSAIDSHYNLLMTTISRASGTKVFTDVYLSRADRVRLIEFLADSLV